MPYFLYDIGSSAKMESPPRQAGNFVELSGLSSNVMSPRHISPKIQCILSQGHSQNLLRIVSCTVAKANRPDRDAPSSRDHSEGHQSPNLSASSPVNIDSADSARDVSSTSSGAAVTELSVAETIAELQEGVADTELSVAETIAELQELVFEWEDLYFEDNDVPPVDTNLNLYVWELRGRRPVPVSCKSLEFGFGRVYIILHVKSLVPSPIMTCFYWTGHKAHFSSVACAAVHAIQLSRRIGCLKTSRQMEGTETADFFDAVGKLSVVPSPPVPSLQVRPSAGVFVASCHCWRYFFFNQVVAAETHSRIAYIICGAVRFSWLCWH